MKTAWLVLAFVVIISGCSNRRFDQEKFAEEVDRGRTVRLADYATFDWDRLHIFAPYTPSEVIRKEVGSSVAFPHSDSEGYCLLGFMSREAIAAIFEVARKQADFAELFRNGGYSREEAIFKIEIRGSDHWRYLKPAN